MKESLWNFARPGLVHHMLFPGSLADPREHAESLLEFIERDDIETFDCCLPSGCGRGSGLAARIRECGKTVCFAAHLYPYRALPIASASAAHRERVREIIAGMVEQAAAINAAGFIFASGPPAYSEAGPRDFEAFDAFCVELCELLEPHGITAMLEPFDAEIDKKFLYGPVDECVELARRLTARGGHFGLELDAAHLPLMGEDFASAVRRCAPFLKRVRLGNCVLRLKDGPLAGDSHPPIGFEGGEIDVPETAAVLRALLECGYLDRNHRGDLVLEITPPPGWPAEPSARDSFARIEKAWSRV